MTNNKEVTLFTNMQMWYHKHIIHFMILFIITGTPLVSHYFNFIAYMFGVSFMVFNGVTPYQETVAVGTQICRIIHRVTAVFGLLTSIPFIMNMLPKIRRGDLTPKLKEGETVKEYVANGLGDVKRIYIDWSYPKYMGKYNLAQIAAAWAVIIICLVMAVTGILLWGRPYISVNLATFSKIVHLGGYVAMLLFPIMHIYFAVHPVNKAGYEAMFNAGKDSLDHVQKKHPGLLNK